MKRFLIKTLKYLSTFIASFALLMLIFAFTSGPFWIYHWLGTKNLSSVQSPKALVLLSGGGIPSEDGLYRIYRAAQAARQFKHTPLIIAMPGDTSDMYSSIMLSKKELELRGIEAGRIFFEDAGKNTRSQALEIMRKFPGLRNDSIVIITAPAHIRRAVLTFEKAGFSYVGSYPTFERVIESDLNFEGRDLGGSGMIPDVGRSVNLRYRFWGHLKLEIDIFRELMAMAYYEVNGWM
ncbi:MAG: YdcF family protein [Bacteroidales bacterium]|nr:YdcF family protein [Bacteroidales bacterium]MCF8344746.1 YdcF family protein [Bacteroidales bacterium]MCF8352103.1 YdcF family protein [Bacteroidales bacterium]MCF8377309.1 YdcF family protein [Bacteroidales bacterium]